MSTPQLLFIVGPPRSGTTWLWSILTSLPNVGSINKKGASESGILLSGPGFAKDWMRRVMTKQPEGTKMVVEKTPGHLHYIDQGKQWFPDAKVVLITRDPADTIHSMMQTKHIRSGECGLPFAHTIPHHAAYRNAAVRNQDLFDHHITYENLFAAPEHEIALLLEAIGVPFTATENYDAVHANHQTNKVGNFRVGRPGQAAEEMRPEELAYIRQAFEHYEV